MAAPDDQRCGEGRLAGRRWRAATPESPGLPPDDRLLRAAAAARLARRQHATPASLHTAAVLALAVGHTREAIDDLAAAVELVPRDGTLWNDLAAAHLCAARGTADLSEVVLALAAADRASAADPGLVAARFNGALALSRLGLPGAAAEQWRMAATSDRDPRWRREAERRGAALALAAPAADWAAIEETALHAAERGDQAAVRAAVSGSPAVRQHFREFLEERCPGRWAAAVRAGRRGAAARYLAACRTLARALAIDGDPLAATALDQIAASQPDARRGAAAWLPVLTALDEGIALARHQRYAPAIPRLAAARLRLRQLGSPLAGWAAFWMAMCHYQETAYGRALPLLRQVSAAARGARGAGEAGGPAFRALAGRGLWLQALIDGIAGRYSISLAGLAEAQEDFRAIRESANAARVGSLLVNESIFLGRTEGAWAHLSEALGDLSMTAENRFGVCEIGALLAEVDGQPRLALRFEDETVVLAERMRRPDLLLQALRQRSALHAAAGRAPAAAQDLARARQLLGVVADLPLRRELEGDLALTAAEIAAARSAAEAVPLFDAAVRILHATSYHLMIGRALAGRAAAESHLGRDDAAERDLRAAIGETERQRSAILAPQERVSFLDRMHSLFDSMVAFQLDRRNRPAEALRFSEEGKARVLLDWLLAAQAAGPPVAVPAGGRLLPAALPADDVIVEYAVLPHELAIWVSRKGAMLQHTTVPIPRSVVEKDVEDLVAAGRAAGSGGEAAPSAERLFALLVAPVARWLPAGSRLTLVPEGPLNRVPFALLIDPGTHRYLIQDHICTVVPSVRILDVALRHARALDTRRRPAALVVAAPRTDPLLDPPLAPLALSDADQATVDLFPGSSLLSSVQATRKAFLTAAPSYEIVHFGGHSVVDPEAPLLSRLILAGDPADRFRGQLFAMDLLHLRLPRTRLVVLASCSTAGGRLSRSEGVESLARVLLAAGVPVVVAALWPVDDDETARFLGRFYRHLASCFDPARSLQAAAMEEIGAAPGHGLPASTWGAFVVIGASAPPDDAACRP
jgi:CHAT domain-containing protein